MCNFTLLQNTINLKQNYYNGTNKEVLKNVFRQYFSYHNHLQKYLDTISGDNIINHF